MAVLCEAGHSEIEFKFMPVGFRSGLMITAVSIFLFIVYLSVFAIIGAAKKKRAGNEIVTAEPTVMGEFKNDEELDRRIDSIIGDIITENDGDEKQ